MGVSQSQGPLIWPPNNRALIIYKDTDIKDQKQPYSLGKSWALKAPSAAELCKKLVRCEGILA